MRYIYCGIGIFVVVNIVAIARWLYIMHTLGIHATYRESFMSYICAYFFNLFFPSFIAGDIFRAATISSRYGKVSETATSVFMDRFSGSLSLAMVAVISAAIGWGKVSDSVVPKALFILFGLIAIAGFIVLTRRPFTLALNIMPKGKLRDTFSALHDKLYFFRKNPKYLLASILISTPIHILTAAYFYVNGLAFGLNNGLIDYLIAVPILMAISLIPVTIAGAGTREAASIYFLGLVGVAKAPALSLSLMVLFYLIAFGIVGGILYLTVYHRFLTTKKSGQ